MRPARSRPRDAPRSACAARAESPPLHRASVPPPTRLGSRVFFNVPAILCRSRRPDEPDAATGQRGLEDIGSVHRRTATRASAHKCVDFVDKEDHFRLLLGLLDDRLQSLLEFSAILRASDERGHGNFHDPRGAQKLRALARCNPLRQPLHDPGLADARFTAEDRVGFALLRKNPRHPENLVLPTDHRLQFAAPREFGDVPAEKRERRLLLLPRRGDTLCCLS